MKHSIRRQCHKQIPKQDDYRYELPLGLFSFLSLHSKTLNTGELTAPAALLFQRPRVTWLCSENSSSPRVPAPILLSEGAYEPWQQPLRHDGPWPDTRPSTPTLKQAVPVHTSKPGCDLRHVQLQSCLPPVVNGSFPDGENHHST